MSATREGTPPRGRWAELFDAPAVSGARAALLDLGALSPPERLFPEKALSLRSGVVSAAVVQLGAAETGATVAAWAPVLETARDHLVRFLPRHPAEYGAGFPSLLNALRCCGAAPDGAEAPVPGWLDALAKHARLLSTEERLTTALACVAHGRPERVPDLVGGGKLPARFESGREFYDLMTPFARSLAVARLRGAAYGEVEPAFRAFLWSFPALLADRRASWNDLLWVGRILVHGLEGRPLSEVAAAVLTAATAV